MHKTASFLSFTPRSSRPHLPSMARPLQPSVQGNSFQGVQAHNSEMPPGLMRCHVETFLERSSIVPSKVVSRNLLCGFFCYNVEVSTSVDISGSSTVKFEGCGIYSNSADWVGSKHLNLSGNFSPSPRCGKFPGTDMQSPMFSGICEMHRDLNLSWNVPPLPRCGKFPGIDV